MKVALMSHAYGPPVRATHGSAGLDIHSADDVLISPWQRERVRTGLRFELDDGWEIQVRSRSGLAANNGTFVLNSPGTLDSDYRGELIIILQNMSMEELKIERGMRIAQLVLAQTWSVPFQIVEENELSLTERGEGRFGSTGL